MSETQQPRPDEPQGEPESQPEAPEAPEADSDEDAGSDDAQVGRRPEFIEEGTEE